MSLPIFPISPVPAGLSRERDWADNVTNYDSGAHQGITPRLYPFYNYSIPFQNFTEVAQSSLSLFVDDRRGMVLPFLFKDPYENRVNSVLGVRSGYASGSGTLFLYDTRSFFVRADTTTIGSLFSSLSGYVRLGLEYSYSQDTGVLTVNTKAVTDVWGVRSMEYWRKCVFAEKYTEQAVIWNVFNAVVRINQVA